MKINQAKKHVLNFFDFTVQSGMFFGYDEKNIPFVTNGNVYGANINAYFLDGQNPDGKYRWKKLKINKYKNERLFVAISHKSAQRGDLKYMNKAELEAARWSKKEYENEGVLFQGHRSSHYHYNMAKIAITK